MSESVERAVESLAGNSSRRGFLSRVSRAMFLLTGGSVVAASVKPGESDAYHFCGHIFTTGSCPHPAGLPRIDSEGYPIRSSDGKKVDNLGRLVNADGTPIASDGTIRRDTDGVALPPAPRTKVCDEVSEQYGFNTWTDGSWYRCCGGTIRKLADCCAYSNKRINGDAALTGYCYQGRKVFCVMYFQTSVPC